MIKCIILEIADTRSRDAYSCDRVDVRKGKYICHNDAFPTFARASIERAPPIKIQYCILAEYHSGSRKGGPAENEASRDRNSEE